MQKSEKMAEIGHFQTFLTSQEAQLEGFDRNVRNVRKWLKMSAIEGTRRTSRALARLGQPCAPNIARRPDTRQRRVWGRRLY